MLKMIWKTYYLCFLWVPQCFFTPKCQREQAAANALVHNISEWLTSQHSVRCFVDPTEQADSAILRRIYDRAAVFHSLFWPTCTLIGGSIIVAMVKLTQYLSIVSERLRRFKMWRRILVLEDDSRGAMGQRRDQSEGVFFQCFFLSAAILSLRN